MKIEAATIGTRGRRLADALQQFAFAIVEMSVTIAPCRSR